MGQTAGEILVDAGYEDTVIFTDYSYDDALIGVTVDGRAVYDYERMVIWLTEIEGFTWEEAVEWVDYNTVRALPYGGPLGPIIMYPLTGEDHGGKQ